MTSLTLDAPRRPLWPFLLMALLLAVAGATIAVQPRRHAVDKHGEEAVAIRQSCNERGPEQVWRSLSPRDPDKFFLVCALPDGRQGLRVIRCVRGAWRELTAFVPSSEATGNGTPERIREYLIGKSKPFKGRLSSACP